MKKHVHESDDKVIRNYDAYDHVLCIQVRLLHIQVAYCEINFL